MAIRIEINDEINALNEGLHAAIASLKINGKICVISYHSLEDRTTKQIFRYYQKESTGIRLLLVNKKPYRPEEGEIHENPRSRSAKLRAAQRAPGGNEHAAYRLPESS